MFVPRTLACFLIGCLLMKVVWANDLYVSPNGNDNNSGSESSPFASISYAVSVAQSGDSIMLQSGTFSEADTIVVSGTSLNFATASGQQDVVINIPAAPSASIFSLAGSAVSFRNFALNGKGGTEACVVSDSSALALTGVFIHDCTSTTDNGGAISATQSSVLLSQCTLADNTAGMSGGAIFSDQGSSLAVLDSAFNGNTAQCRNFSFGGGAIYSRDGNLTVAGSSFQGNWNNDCDGGAILADRASKRASVANINASSFDSNYCAGDGGSGGAVCGDAVVTNCKFTNNSAFVGGAMFAVTSLQVVESVFANNRADSGGALYAESSTVNVVGSAFSNNTCPPTYSSNTGGAIFTARCTATVKSCTFTENKAYVGGAIYNEGYEDQIIRPTGYLTVTACTFESNVAWQAGGGIGNGVEGQAEIDRCTFTGNTAGLSGGVIYNSGVFTSSQCKFTNNSATSFGGAFYSLGYIDVGSATVSGSSATFGGAVFIVQGNSYFESTTFSNNTASQDGGAVFIEGGEADWVVNVFQCNSAGLEGMDVYSPSTEPFTFKCTSCTFNPC